MSRQTQLNLCRFGFVLFCLIPTLVVGRYVFWPESADDWERDLQSNLGVMATIESVDHPQPGITQLKDVTVHDIETGPMFALDRAELSDRDDKLAILVANSFARIDRLDQVVFWIENEILKKRTRSSSRVVIQLDSLSLVHDETTIETLRDVTIVLDETDHGPKLSLSFRIDESNNDERVEMSIERRNRSTADPRTRWKIATGDARIRCSVLAHVIPSLAAFGDSCKFQGIVWVEQTPAGIIGEINGQLEQVDLHQLIGRNFSHTIQGIATIRLSGVRLVDGKLINAAGSLEVNQGVAGLSLITSAAKYLRVRQVRALAQEQVAFGKLAFAFQLDERRLKIQGRCDDAGTMMVDGQGVPILVESHVPAVDKLELVRMLVPQANVYVPLTDKTKPLISLLSRD